MSCYEACNAAYGATDPGRTYCKKACDSDEDTFAKCKSEFCSGLCVKTEIGEEGAKEKSPWMKWLARAPAGGSEDCINACYHGCKNKDSSD